MRPPLLILALVGLTLAGLSPSRSAPIAAQTLPIIDLHFHFAAGWDIEATVRTFDRVGVARAGNGARAAPDTLALEWARRYPERFLPFGGKDAVQRFLGTYREQAWRLEAAPVLAYLAEIEAGLRAGAFKGIGEITVPPGRLPLDSPLLQRLWDLSATYGVPMSVHMDARAELLTGMERLLAANRKGRWLWAHAGAPGAPADAALLRRLLQAHPNLSCDLSLRVLELSRPEWTALLEEFPDRCVIGTDVQTPAQYPLMIAAWRAVLSVLSPATAAAIAHRNGERLLRLPPTGR